MGKIFSKKQSVGKKVTTSNCTVNKGMIYNDFPYLIVTDEISIRIQDFSYMHITDRERNEGELGYASIVLQNKDEILITKKAFESLTYCLSRYKPPFQINC